MWVKVVVIPGRIYDVHQVENCATCFIYSGKRFIYTVYNYKATTGAIWGNDDGNYDRFLVDANNGECSDAIGAGITSCFIQEFIMKPKNTVAIKPKINFIINRV